MVELPEALPEEQPVYQAPPAPEQLVREQPQPLASCLRQAARSGDPFCAAAEAPRPEAALERALGSEARVQAVTLKRAAAAGAPLCEVCRRRQEALAAQQEAAEAPAPAAPAVAGDLVAWQEAAEAPAPAAPAVEGVLAAAPQVQAAVLRDASSSGVPFCEACEKARTEAAG